MKIDGGFSIYQVFTIGVPEETWSKLGNICTDSIMSTGCLYREIQTPPQEDTLWNWGSSASCLKRTRRNFFRHRVVNRWNMLADNIVTSPSVNIFKNRRCLLACSQMWTKRRFPTHKRPPRPANRLLAYLRAEEDVCMYVCMYVCLLLCSSFFSDQHITRHSSVVTMEVA